MPRSCKSMSNARISGFMGVKFTFHAISSNRNKELILHQSRSGPKACVKWLLLDFYIKKNLGGGVLSKFGSKSSQISWGSQKNQIWSDRSGKRWRDNDRREKVPFQALIIKEIWEKCPKMRFLLFLTRFIKLYEKLTYFIL